MAPPLWDPWQLFNITTWDTDNMKCVGISIRGPSKSHCIYDISNEVSEEIRSIISKMRTKPPNEALPNLDRLARLCLCSEAHQNQKVELTKKWRALVKYAGEGYEKVEKLKRDIQVQKAKLEATREEYALNKETYEVNVEENAKLVKEVEQHKLAVIESRQESEAQKVQLNETKARFDKELEFARRIMCNSSAVTEIDIGKLRSELEKEREAAAKLTKFYQRMNSYGRINQLAEDLQDLEKARQTWGMYKLAAEAECENQSMVIRNLRTELDKERLNMEEYKITVGKERESHLLKIQTVSSEVEKYHQTAQKDARVAKTESENQSMVIRHLQTALEKEHQDMEEYKIAATKEREGYLLDIQKIRSELERQHHTKKKNKKAIEMERRGMVFVIRSIHAALERERQISNQHRKSHEVLKSEMDQAMKIARNREARLLEEISNLRFQTQNFKGIGQSLIRIRFNKTVLYEQEQNLDSQLICAHESKNKSDGEYAKIKAREATLTKGLEITRLSLGDLRNANGELKNTTAENDLDLILERAQLIVGISEIEKQLSTTVWNVLRGTVHQWTTFGVRRDFGSMFGSRIFVKRE